MSTRHYSLTSHGVFSGQHDRAREEPRHPEALWPQGERTLCLGGRDVLPDGGPGSPLHVHWRLRLLPQTAGGGALRLQRPQGTIWLQVVEPGHVNKHCTVDRDGLWCSGRKQTESISRVCLFVFGCLIMYVYFTLLHTSTNLSKQQQQMRVQVSNSGFEGIFFCQEWVTFYTWGADW